ncbi:MAG: methyl-accepting chemotaxis protein [Cellvibrionaceae bacterium]|nr:methyl-accepting chemotaxis protein [Cellvibrionaceae bacterium]
MNGLNFLSIKMKLMLPPIIALIGLSAVLSYQYTVSNNNIDRLNTLRDQQLPAMLIASSQQSQLERLQDIYNSAVTMADQDILANADNLHKSMQEGLAQQAQLQKQNSKAIAQQREQLQLFVNANNNLAQALIGGDFDPQNLPALVSNKEKLYKELNSAFQSGQEEALSSFNQQISQANSNAESSSQIGVLAGIALVIFLSLVTGFSTWTITSQINNVSNSLKEIAEGDGDLTLRLTQQGNDEIGQLVNWFNIFIAKLHSTVGDMIKLDAPMNQLADRLKQLAGTSLNDCQQQQDASCELVQAMDELIQSTENIAGSAATAAEATSEADQDAKAETENISKTSLSIRNLSSDITAAANVISSLQQDVENVSGILDVIKVIAEQTNLLALNAAIEAARAGEQGRGFAVVADEVRTLASKTQDSTQEIQQLIEKLELASNEAVNVMSSSQQQVGLNADQVQETGVTLQTISGSVASIASMNHQIAAATEQQDSSGRAIQSNVSALTEATQRVAQSAENLSDMSKDLSQFSDQLSAVSAQFKV